MARIRDGITGEIIADDGWLAKELAATDREIKVIDAARDAVARINARPHEEAEAWAERLAADLGKFAD